MKITCSWLPEEDNITPLRLHITDGVTRETRLTYGNPKLFTSASLQEFMTGQRAIIKVCEEGQRYQNHHHILNDLKTITFVHGDFVISFPHHKGLLVLQELTNVITHCERMWEYLKIHKFSSPVVNKVEVTDTIPGGFVLRLLEHDEVLQKAIWSGTVDIPVGIRKRDTELRSMLSGTPTFLELKENPLFIVTIFNLGDYMYFDVIHNGRHHITAQVLRDHAETALGEVLRRF
jgi:hypothetical protein